MPSWKRDVHNQYRYIVEGVDVGGVAQVGWRNLELGSAWRALREPLGLGGTCGDREVMVPFRGLESE